jgi:hypothetical protein
MDQHDALIVRSAKNETAPVGAQLVRYVIMRQPATFVVAALLGRVA